MNFVLAVLAYLVLGAIIGIGLLKAATGSFAILLIGLVIFLGLFIKAGCLSGQE